MEAQLDEEHGCGGSASVAHRDQVGPCRPREPCRADGNRVVSGGHAAQPNPTGTTAGSAGSAAPIKTALLVSAVNPYPVDAGKKVALAGLVEHLADRLGPDNVHYLLVGRPGEAPGTFPVVLHAAPRPSAAEQLRSIATRTASGRSSLQEAMLRGPRTGAAVRAAVEQVDPDLILFDTVRMAQYAPQVPLRPGRRRVCYLDDLFSERYRGMLEARREHPDVHVEPLGSFGTAIVPRRLRWLAGWGPSQRLLLEAERRLVARSERRAAATLDGCLLVNANEAALLEGQVPGARVHAIPLLVSSRSPERASAPGRPDYVMVGLLSLPHNEDGLLWFLRDVLPLLLARRPDATLTVVGRDAGPRVRDAAVAAGPAVRLLGFVPDLDACLSSSAALINPLRFGSGIKLKVLDALARGIPVVSTTVGADGIAAGPGTGITEADTPEAFAAALAELADPERGAPAGEDAREHYRRSYARDVVFAAYDRALGL